jgi:hypothetical protein
MKKFATIVVIVSVFLTVTPAQAETPVNAPVSSVSGAGGVLG